MPADPPLPLRRHLLSQTSSLNNFPRAPAAPDRRHPEIPLPAPPEVSATALPDSASPTPPAGIPPPRFHPRAGSPSRSRHTPRNRFPASPPRLPPAIRHSTDKATSHSSSPLLSPPPAVSLSSF